jgi:hypothetical protein
MPDDYEFYQGVVLRQVVTQARTPVRLGVFRTQGRVNSFILDNAIGLFIKHSSNRMPPWQFTFHSEQAREFKALAKHYKPSFAAFVCGDDGFAVVQDTDVWILVEFKSNEQAWVRIERRRRSLYSISGNRAALPTKVPRGPGLVIDALEHRT